MKLVVGLLVVVSLVVVMLNIAIIIGIKAAAVVAPVGGKHVRGHTIPRQPRFLVAVQQVELETTIILVFLFIQKNIVGGEE